MKEKIIKNSKGITLIALVITIIILIILAGVSIKLVFGTDGIIYRAKIGSVRYREEQARERLEIILEEAKINKNSNENFDIDSYLNDVFANNNIDVDEGVVIVDGWQFKINKEKLSISEALGEETKFTKETRNKAFFSYEDKEVAYVSEGKLTINVDDAVQNYTLQYNLEEKDANSSNWQTYTIGNEISVSKNSKVYGRFVNLETNEIGYKFEIEITNIDEINPETSQIKFNKTAVNTSETIKATVTMSDNQSGIDITKCKYIINESSAKIGEDSTSWNSAATFTTNPQELSITKTQVKSYYVHVLSVDAAGNKIETVSEKIKFKGVTTYLNKQLAAYNTLTGYTVYNSESSNYIRVKGTTKSYMVSNQMYDLTEIDKLQLYCEKLYVDVSSSTIVTFGISKTKQSTNFDKSVQLTKNNSGSGQYYEITMDCDTSNITGSYYIKVMAQNTVSGRQTFLSGLNTIKGY